MLKILSLASRYWQAIVVILIVVIGFFAIRSYGNAQYQAGVDETIIKVEREAARLTAAMQEERDNAEAKYRGAVLARQAVESSLRDRDTRIRSLLNQLRAKQSEMAQTSGGIDGTGADWIGIFGACYAEYSELGGTTAELADKVGGLQGYINGVLKTQ